jgi:hypothetical protein
MSILKKPETYIGAAAVALVACLANCPNTDGTPSPIPEAKELKSRRTITRQDIEDIIRDFGVKEDESEFSVHVPLDENGEIPENFDYVGAVRDCVESAGLYRCINRRSMPMSVCHSIDEDNPVSPVSLARNLNDDVVVGYSILE